MNLKHKKWFRALFRRRILVTMLLLLQIIFLVYMVLSTSKDYKWMSSSLVAVSLLVVLYIINKKDKPAYKMMWVLLILIFPIFGGLFYLLFRYQRSMKRFRKQIQIIEKETRPLFMPKANYLKNIQLESPEYLPQAHYLQNFVGFPVYQNTETEYLTPGEEKFERLKEELEKAERYIFLEYFIIQEGMMWNSILDILIKKVKQGVEVRVIYDDMGCFFLLPKDYHKKLEALGIQCVVFNSFRPVLSAIQNNRDHRKIAVIDGKVAFTGGINLADEYINAFEKHGHWKDASIMIKGEAAWSFTLMFLQMWNLCKNTVENYEEYYPWQDQACPTVSDGYVQPYSDSPMDKENVGEHVYLQMIHNAKKYIYINTPYLIIDDTMMSALTLAAKSGIDVRIVTPHIWDKWFVHMTTRSYYRELIKAGVKIYEYTNGFIHSKIFVSDDQVATVGTINLDFRSLYLHFECGVWLHKTSSILEIKKDFLETIKECHEITLEDCKNSTFMRFVQEILRVFAPLM